MGLQTFYILPEDCVNPQVSKQAPWLQLWQNHCAIIAAILAGPLPLKGNILLLVPLVAHDPLV